MSTRSIRRAGTALVLALGLALSACGGSDDSGSDSDKEATPVSDPLSEDDFAERIVEAQQDAGTAHMKMNMSAQGQEAKADGQIEMGESVDDLKMTMQMTAQGQEMDMRMFGTTMYMNMGEQSENKFWEIDLDDDSDPLAEQFGGFADQADPQQQIEDMADAVTSFEEKGSATVVDDVSTQPYSVKVDPEKLNDDMEDAPEDEIPDSLEYTMYVDDDDLLRKMTMDVEDTKMTMAFAEWGESVNIEKPDDSDIADEDEMPSMGGDDQDGDDQD